MKFLSQRLPLFGLLVASHAMAAATPDQLAFFEKSIRPLLIEHCADCHGATKHENGLRLDTQAAVTKGSDYGLVIKPGDPAGSKLIKAVKHQPGAEAMPKKGAALKSEQIALLEQWIRDGAAWPDDKIAGAIKPKWQDHWAFQKVVRPLVPGGATRGLGDPVDAFVGSKLAAVGLKPAPPADAMTLCRRLHLTLTGLLPTYVDVQQFKVAHARDAAAATRELIDHLLATPAYGERWARVWLDVARYSDTEGYQVAGKDIRYPYAYTYRDWVVRALNADMPYDRFVSLQLAADRLCEKPDAPDLAALGFLTVNDTFIGSRDLQTDDRIDVTARGLLGLTVGCARCHDHKYDPIATRDYYGLYSIFNSSEVPDELPVIGKPASEVAFASYQAETAKINEQKAAFRKEVYADLRKPERLAAYLAFVREAKGLSDEAFRGRAGQLQLRDRVAKRWQAFVDQVTTGASPNPVMVAWQEFVKLKPEEFAVKGPQILQALSEPGSKCSPGVAAAFKDKAPPGSFADVAATYAALFLKHEHSPNAQDGIRALLARPGSPMAVKVDDMEDFFTRKDRETIVRLDNQFKKIELANPGAPPRAMVMRDRAKPADVHIFIRGNPARQGGPAPRANLSLLGGQEFKEGSGRLELARAITSRDNPLTARVIVNRVWLQHFGKPLVPNPSDFGVQTVKPEQAALLDYLAATFMDSGWSLKSLHRLILSSATYQQSSTTTPEKDTKDAENSLLSRFNRTRLDYETMRDTLVQVTGMLDTASMGGRAVPLNTKGIDSRRTLYHLVDRYDQATVPAMFDFANPDNHSAQRYVTNVPQQALFLMNSPFMQRQAATLANQLPVQGSTPDSATVRALYQRVLLRDPTPSEIETVGRFVAQARDLQEQTAFSWTYGTERLVRDEKGNETLADWTPFEVLKDEHKRPTWSHTGIIPDKQWHYAMIYESGGHAPAGDLVASRVWKAPTAMTIRITGEVFRSSDAGNGVRAMIFSKRSGMLVTALAEPKHKRASVEVLKLAVQAGDELHFAIGNENGDTNSDTYEWAPEISLLHEDGCTEPLTNARIDFCGKDRWPLNRAKAQTPLQQVSQALLMSNEFMFVD